MRTFINLKKFACSGASIIFAMSVFSLPQAFAAQKKYIVKLKQPSGFLPQDIQTSVRGYQTRALASEVHEMGYGQATAKPLDRLGITIVMGDESIESLLNNHPDVAHVELDQKIYKPQNITGATPSGQQLSPWLSPVMGLVDSEPSANLGYAGSSPVVVAVVDTGLTHAHPYISNALAINAAEQGGIAGVDDDGNGYIDDIYGGNAILKNGNIAEVSTDHGSHVAGLVKAIRDQAAVDYPDARAVKILPIRFIDQSGVGSTSGALEAISYAINRGAKVLNASWGAKGPEAFSQALFDAMNELYYTHDVMITVAAGNSEGNGPNNNDLIPYFPAGFLIPGLLSVGSVTPEFSNMGGGNVGLSSMKFSDFSNYGKRTVHIAAPGSFRNAQFASPGVFSMNANYTSSSNYFVTKKGTSMAAPVVAGIAGVVRAINPSLTAYEVRQIIINSAVASDIANTKVESGAIAHAMNAFVEADNAVTQGLKPQATGEPYVVYSQNETDNSAGSRSSGGGGCGSISPVDLGGGSGQGPFGGNSIVLFSLSYFLFVSLRKILKRSPKYFK